MSLMSCCSLSLVWVRGRYLCELVAFFYENGVTHHHLLFEHAEQFGVAHHLLRYHDLVVFLLSHLEHVLRQVLLAEGLAALAQPHSLLTTMERR